MQIMNLRETLDHRPRFVLCFSAVFVCLSALCCVCVCVCVCLSLSAVVCVLAQFQFLSVCFTNVRTQDRLWPQIAPPQFLFSISVALESSSPTIYIARGIHSNLLIMLEERDISTDSDNPFVAVLVKRIRNLKKKYYIRTLYPDTTTLCILFNVSC